MTLPFSCRLSATGIRFLGVLFPPRNSASLTVGLPPPSRITPATTMDLTGFPRSTRMSYDRVGRPLYPGGDGVHTARKRPEPPPADLHGQPPVHPSNTARPGKLP